MYCLLCRVKNREKNGLSPYSLLLDMDEYLPPSHLFARKRGTSRRELLAQLSDLPPNAPLTALIGYILEDFRDELADEAHLFFPHPTGGHRRRSDAYATRYCGFFRIEGGYLTIPKVVKGCNRFPVPVECASSPRRNLADNQNNASSIWNLSRHSRTPRCPLAHWSPPLRRVETDQPQREPPLAGGGRSCHPVCVRSSNTSDVQYHEIFHRNKSISEAASDRVLCVFPSLGAVDWVE